METVLIIAMLGLLAVIIFKAGFELGQEAGRRQNQDSAQ